MGNDEWRAEKGQIITTSVIAIKDVILGLKIIIDHRVNAKANAEPAEVLKNPNSV